MNATLSPRERASAILSMGIFASLALVAALFVACVFLVVGKAGVAVYSTVSSTLVASAPSIPIR
jgi:hypothetical protein